MGCPVPDPSDLKENCDSSALLLLRLLSELPCTLVRVWVPRVRRGTELPVVC